MSPRTTAFITAATLLLVPALVAAQPATQPYACTAYLDVDNNPSTGGDVQVIQAGDPGPQTVSGIEFEVNAFADLPADPTMWGTVAGVVSAIQVAGWDEGLGSFVIVSESMVDYPAGNGTGLDGHHVIEFVALLSDLGMPTGPIRMLYHVSRPGPNDYTSEFLYQPQEAGGIPTIGTVGAALLGAILAVAGLLVLRRYRALGVGVASVGMVLAFASLAWALTITPDGAVGDWADTPPIVTDPIGDSSASDANEDIVYGFVTNDDTTMGFRIDLLNVAVTNPYTPTPTPPPT